MSGVPRHLVVAALDAFGVGDQREGVGLLLEALEEQGVATLGGPPACAICGVRSSLPERHIYSLHVEAEAVRRAA